MWYADTTSDVQAFEASTKDALSDQIANYYAEDGDNVCQIEAVYSEDDAGVTTTLSDYDLELFCGACEHLNEHLINEAEAEAKADCENRSDYYSNVL